MGGVDGEVVVTHGAPLPVVVHLHPALAVLPLLARQAQLDLNCVCRSLGPLILRLGLLEVLMVLGPDIILGQAQGGEEGEQGQAAAEAGA